MSKNTCSICLEDVYRPAKLIFCECNIMFIINVLTDGGKIIKLYYMSRNVWKPQI